MSYLTFRPLENRLSLWRPLWEKGRDQALSYDEIPYTHRKIHKAKWLYKNATKNLDYTTIAEWFKTVSLNDNSNSTGVVKPGYGYQPSH